jgi:hypothetical protein
MQELAEKDELDTAAKARLARALAATRMCVERGERLLMDVHVPSVSDEVWKKAEEMDVSYVLSKGTSMAWKAAAR